LFGSRRTQLISTKGRRSQKCFLKYLYDAELEKSDELEELLADMIKVSEKQSNLSRKIFHNLFHFLYEENSNPTYNVSI
jgi:hypothetical protein